MQGWTWWTLSAPLGVFGIPSSCTRRVVLVATRRTRCSKSSYAWLRKRAAPPRRREAVDHPCDRQMTFLDHLGSSWPSAEAQRVRQSSKVHMAGSRNRCRVGETGRANRRWWRPKQVAEAVGRSKRGNGENERVVLLNSLPLEVHPGIARGSDCACESDGGDSDGQGTPQGCGGVLPGQRLRACERDGGDSDGQGTPQGGGGVRSTPPSGPRSGIFSGV